MILDKYSERAVDNIAHKSPNNNHNEANGPHSNVRALTKYLLEMWVPIQLIQLVKFFIIK